MNEKDEIITVKLKRRTTGRLKKLGSMGDSYDTVINMLINEHEKR